MTARAPWRHSAPVTRCWRERERHPRKGGRTAVAGERERGGESRKGKLKPNSNEEGRELSRVGEHEVRIAARGVRCDEKDRANDQWQKGSKVLASLWGCRVYGRWTEWCRERWGLFGWPLLALQWRQRVEGNCNECVTAISIRVLWRNSRVITRFFFSPSGSALCFRPVETRVQTPSGAEALGFSAANCYRNSRLSVCVCESLSVSQCDCVAWVDE